MACTAYTYFQVVIFSNYKHSSYVCKIPYLTGICQLSFGYTFKASDFVGTLQFCHSIWVIIFPQSSDSECTKHSHIIPT